MQKKKQIIKGSHVKNITTGEFGIVTEVIGDLTKPFGYTVLTSSGLQRWIIKYKNNTKQSSS